MIDPSLDVQKHVLRRSAVSTPVELRTATEALRRFGDPTSRQRPRVTGDIADPAGALLNLLHVLHTRGDIIDETLVDALSEDAVAGRDIVAAADGKDHIATSVTSTTGVDLTSLQVSLTLKSGHTYALLFVGGIASNADPAGFIFAGCNVDGDLFLDQSDTGTAAGERTLMFGGFKFGVSGAGSAVTMSCRMRVDTGSGATVNDGACLGVAIETG